MKAAYTRDELLKIWQHQFSGDLPMELIWKSVKELAWSMLDDLDRAAFLETSFEAKAVDIRILLDFANTIEKTLDQR